MAGSQAEHNVKLQDALATAERRERELTQQVRQLEEARTILTNRTLAPIPPQALEEDEVAIDGRVPMKIGLTLEYGPPHSVYAVNDLQDEGGVKQVGNRPL
jgi:hypothetical protein